MPPVPRLEFSLLLYLPLLGNAVNSTGGHAGYNIFDNNCNRLYIQYQRRRILALDASHTSY